MWVLVDWWCLAIDPNTNPVDRDQRDWIDHSSPQDCCEHTLYLDVCGVYVIESDIHLIWSWQRSKVVTAFDSNVPTLQISNPFGGAGSSPAVVAYSFALALNLYKVEASCFLIVPRLWSWMVGVVGRVDSKLVSTLAGLAYRQGRSKWIIHSTL